MTGTANSADLRQDLKPRLGRPPSKERWSKREQEVVDAAAHLFAKQGYHPTTIDDLCKATGLQRGGLYHYMDGKADLLIKIHARFIEPLLVATRAVADRPQSAEMALRELARVLMDVHVTYHDQITVFLHEWRIIEDAPDWHAIRTARREFEDAIAGILRRGISEGTISVEDVRLTALAFLGMLNYSYQWFRPDGKLSAGAIADMFCDIFLQGIRARS